jgi:hypothetical protein
VFLKNLLKLKDWVTVPEAASHLSTLFGENVSEADIFRLALDGRLTLSVFFVNGTAAKRGKMIARADAEIETVQTINGNKFERVKGVLLDKGSVLSFDDDITYIKRVWDLAMIDGGRTLIERKYQFLTGGPEVDLMFIGDLFVNRSDGAWAHLVHRNETYTPPYNHPDNYIPAEDLPSDALLVVRTSALQNLVALSEPEPAMERPIGQRERDTLLVIIAALAEVQGIDVKRPSKAALAIENATIQKGARISARAIEDHLRRIPDALERKGAED